MKIKNLIPIIIMIAFSACSKSNENTQPPAAQKILVRFYTDNPVASAKLIYITVNGITIGRLLYSSSIPACGSSEFTSASLEPGVYKAGYVDPSNSGANKEVSFTVSNGTNNCIFFNIR